MWNADQGYEPALKAFDASLGRLGVDYVDLYLIHWPLQDDDRILRTWDALEKIAESGRAKAIGVCNFEPRHLQLLIDRGGVVPAVDQVELHPHLAQQAIRDVRRRARHRGRIVEPARRHQQFGVGRRVEAEHAAHGSDHHPHRRPAQQERRRRC